jgi:D-sedoheptulose 7-phosphate isomerase
MIEEIKDQFNQNIKLHETSREQLSPLVLKAAELIIEALKKGNKLLFCGNGGSAADSQHLAAEFVGRFKKERKGLPAIALTTDTSILTALANDYGYDSVFARQVGSLGQKDDVLIVISTSGNSVNLIKAAERAKNMGLKTIGFLGSDGGKLKDLVDLALVVPSRETARIQEVHILIGHIICHLVEKNF